MQFRAHISLAFFLSTFSFHLFAQVPTQTPVEDEGEVVKITTSLIQLDVVVSDKKGNRIADLEPEDFELFENGIKQNITNLTYISAQKAALSGNSKKNEQLSIPIPQKKLREEEIRRTFALVVDDLGLSFGSIYWVRKSLEKFVNEQMRDGDLVAIVRTGGGLGAIQPFTSDKGQLLATIKKLKWNPNGRVGISTFEPLRTTLREDLDGTIDADGNVRSMAGTEDELAFLKEMDEIRANNFSVGSLGSLNFIIRGMKEMPGRKSLLLFSEGYGSSPRIFDALKLLADVANRSSVVIYGLDPRGIEVVMRSAEDSGLPSIGGADTALEGRLTRLRETQSSLRYLADETGGFAFINQNDLNKGVRDAVDDQSYYLIAYEPDSDTFDPKKSRYNKISIKANRPDAEVRYRSGFFAIADDKVNTRDRTPAGKLRNALLSPFGANEIDLRLYTIAGNDEKDGEFIRSLVNIAAKDLRFSSEPNGNKKANFDVVAVTFGDDGKAIDQLLKNFTIQVDEKNYQKILERGFVYDLSVNLKNAGAYQFRIALRDSATGKIGSASKFVEVPKFTKHRVWLSNLLIEGYSIEDSRNISTKRRGTTAFTDTTLRSFKSPVVLQYGAVVYNAKTGKDGMPKLSLQNRLINNGKVILVSNPQPIRAFMQRDPRRLDIVGRITIGNDLPSGDYVLQIVIRDELAKTKRNIATQWIDFEISE